jgi:hypothetical protein
MSFMDDECDFCGCYMDPIGCDTQQILGQKAWCGQCPLSSDTTTPLIERKAAAWDALEKGVVETMSRYWNDVARSSPPEVKVWKMHLLLIDLEDYKRAVQSQYNLK